jgi:hypothetical protein
MLELLGDAGNLIQLVFFLHFKIINWKVQALSAEEGLGTEPDESGLQLFHQRGQKS